VTDSGPGPSDPLTGLLPAGVTGAETALQAIYAALDDVSLLTDASGFAARLVAWSRADAGARRPAA